MSTLLISDLHLGARIQHGVLVRPDPLARLLDAVRDVDRLVLLGDIVELLERRPAEAMRIAEPVLRALGRRLEPGREVILVPGNHDFALVRAWVTVRGSALGLDDAIPLDASAALARVAGWLAPADVTVRYPGVWLSDRVWATHGHYLDRHLVPDSPVGLIRGVFGGVPRDRAAPVDYELAAGVSFSRLEALLTNCLPKPLAALAEATAELVRAATMPLPRRLLHPWMAPLTARLLSLQMRRASIPALCGVVASLGIDSDWVLFGHVHRRGPLPDDNPDDWRDRSGPTRIVNTGSWVYEPLLVHQAIPPHPYWPGGAVLIEDGRDPRTVGLLDELDAEALR